MIGKKVYLVIKELEFPWTVDSSILGVYEKHDCARELIDEIIEHERENGFYNIYPYIGGEEKAVFVEKKNTEYKMKLKIEDYEIM